MRTEGDQRREAGLLSPQRYSAARFHPLEATQWAEWVEVTEGGATARSEAAGGVTTSDAADQRRAALAEVGSDGLEAV